MSRLEIDEPTPKAAQPHCLENSHGIAREGILERCFAHRLTSKTVGSLLSGFRSVDAGSKM